MGAVLLDVNGSCTCISLYGIKLAAFCITTMEIPAATTKVNLFAGFESHFIYSSSPTKFGQGIYTVCMSPVLRIQLQS